MGIYNERHFVLFMCADKLNSWFGCTHSERRAYLILATFWFTLLGYDKMWEALGLTMVTILILIICKYLLTYSRYSGHTTCPQSPLR